MSAFRTAGGLMQIAAIHYRDAANDLVDVAVGRFRNAALKTFFSAIAASIPEEVQGFRNKSTGTDIPTPSVAVTVTGGSMPYTYAWSRTDGGSDTWTIGSATAASTTFTAVGVASGDTRTATFICTVTDASGAVAASNPITATAVNLGGGGPL